MSEDNKEELDIDVMDEKAFRESLLTTLQSIDWKLWEIYQISKQFED